MSQFSSHAVTSIVDEWMKDSNSLLPSSFAQNDGAASAAMDIPISKGRVGLGFENKSLGHDGSRVKNDVLLDKLKKSKKRKLEEEKNLPIAVSSHGLVENDDDEFESRIQLVASLSKKPEAQSSQQHKKQGLENKKQKLDDNTKIGDDGKTPNGADNFFPNNSKSSEKLRISSSSSQSKPEVKSTAPTSASKILTNANTAAPKLSDNGHANNSIDTGCDVKKRKRVKTRSKQKNIRRDNRPDDQKPTHLKFGAKDYKGRPITAATRDKLGLPEKLRKHSTPKEVLGNYSWTTDTV